jgi:hypothetical protein
VSKFRTVSKKGAGQSLPKTRQISDRGRIKATAGHLGSDYFESGDSETDRVADVYFVRLLTTEVRTCYSGGVIASPQLEIQIWPIDRLILYARNPRKNDAVVDRMCPSIREFGFKIPVLARSDGHLRIKAARKLRIDQIPVILCDEWSAAQVKAIRLMVNRSVNWASWDDELLALELQELSEADFDLSLTGFDSGEIDAMLVAPEDDERANAASRYLRARFCAPAISGFVVHTACSASMQPLGRTDPYER